MRGWFQPIVRAGTRVVTVTGARSCTGSNTLTCSGAGSIASTCPSACAGTGTHASTHGSEHHRANRG